MPSVRHSVTMALAARTPALWPSLRDRPRACAQRPLPSMMMAIWAGSEAAGIGSGEGSDMDVRQPQRNNVKRPEGGASSTHSAGMWRPLCTGSAAPRHGAAGIPPETAHPGEITPAEYPRRMSPGECPFQEPPAQGAIRLRRGVPCLWGEAICRPHQPKVSKGREARAGKGRGQVVGAASPPFPVPPLTDP